MLKTSLFCFLFFLSISICSAQNFKGGFYAGMTTSQIDGDAMRGYHMPGFNVGAFTQVALGDQSNLKLELAYIQKGSRDTLNLMRFRVNYVEIPVIYSLRWNFLSFEIGPALDILASSKDDGQGVTQYNQNDYRKVSLSGIVGVSYHFNEQWHINFRSNNSITPMTPPSDRPSVSKSFYQKVLGAGWRNIVLSFGVNYTFNR